MSIYISKLKYLIKNVIAYSLYYSGALSVIKRSRLKNRAIILTYHRILPYSVRKDSFSHSAIMVDNQRFDKQIRFLKRHFRIVDTSHLVEKLNSNSAFDDFSCLITFDDGWRDNYDYALPVLTYHKVPALIFPALDYIETGRLFWQEAMGHGFFQLLKNADPGADELLHKHGLGDLKHQSDDVQIERIRQYVRELKSLSYSEINGIFDEITAVIGAIDYGNVDRYLDWAHIREMYDLGIDFGSHACSHRILTRLDEEEVSEELTRSKALLENRLETDIKTIAYPNGDYDSQLGNLTKIAGYTTGFGTEFGSVTHKDDAFNLNRINVNDMTSRNNPIMLATILGLF